MATNDAIVMETDEIRQIVTKTWTGSK